MFPFRNPARPSTVYPRSRARLNPHVEGLECRALLSLGDTITSLGGYVKVEILPTDALYTDSIFLTDLPGSTNPPTIYPIGDNHETGKVVDLGYFPAGHELEFG